MSIKLDEIENPLVRKALRRRIGGFMFLSIFDGKKEEDASYTEHTDHTDHSEKYNEIWDDYPEQGGVIEESPKYDD